MAKIGLFYGSSTGNTEYVAYEIKAEIDKKDPSLVDIFNIGAAFWGLVFGLAISRLLER